MVGTAVDTATEVALLAISAAAPGQGIPIYLILLLPSLFTAAMAMIDTLDGILMVSKTKHPSSPVLPPLPPLPLLPLLLSSLFLLSDRSAPLCRMSACMNLHHGVWLWRRRLLQLWAYGWAFVDPNRKLGYNIFGACPYCKARRFSLFAIHVCFLSLGPLPR